jgi:hypothetical protein|tara:strand:- start:156 stop:338 length:183 start_codon:yes stop_codon:yes gene_type:complete
MEKTLKQLDKASELLYVLAYAIDKGFTKDDIDQSWIDSAKKLSREINKHMIYLTDLDNNQ